MLQSDEWFATAIKCDVRRLLAIGEAFAVSFREAFAMFLEVLRCHRLQGSTRGSRDLLLHHSARLLNFRWMNGRQEMRFNHKCQMNLLHGESFTPKDNTLFNCICKLTSSHLTYTSQYSCKTIGLFQIYPHVAFEILSPVSAITFAPGIINRTQRKIMLKVAWHLHEKTWRCSSKKHLPLFACNAD